MASAQFDKLNYLGRLRLVIVILVFSVPVALTLVQLGFLTGTSHGNINTKGLFSTELLIAVNIACGLLGGLVMAQKQRIIYMISGAVVSFVTTAASFLYFFWRTSVIAIEAIIPLGAGIIIGVLTFKILSKLFPAKEQKSYTTPQ
ncbi:MAG: hypothetical protein WCK13_04790 [Ignavibacteriota bacterium]|nr:hypothetical protein [Ignavibacteriota bacterium]